APSRGGRLRGALFPCAALRASPAARAPGVRLQVAPSRGVRVPGVPLRAAPLPGVPFPAAHLRGGRAHSVPLPAARARCALRRGSLPFALLRLPPLAFSPLGFALFVFTELLLFALRLQLRLPLALPAFRLEPFAFASLRFVLLLLVALGFEPRTLARLRVSALALAAFRLVSRAFLALPIDTCVFVAVACVLCGQHFFGGRALGFRRLDLLQEFEKRRAARVDSYFASHQLT